MAAVTAALVLLVIAICWLLLRAFRHNRALWSEVKAARRRRRALLWDALVLWSPLAAVILVFALACNWLSASAVELAYRLSTLDDFCQVRDVAGQPVIACTGMDGWLAPGALRRAGVQADLDYFVSQHYRQARRRFLALSARQLRQLAVNRPALYRSLSAPAVLGVESAPVDDQEVLRLQQERREIDQYRSTSTSKSSSTATIGDALKSKLGR